MYGKAYSVTDISKSLYKIGRTHPTLAIKFEKKISDLRENLKVQ
jgi:hypothetical protein